MIDDELEAATRFNGSDDDSSDLASRLPGGVVELGKKPRPLSVPSVPTQLPSKGVWQQKPVNAAITQANTTAVLPDMAL